MTLRRSNARLYPRAQVLLYTCIALLWLSGAVWLALAWTHEEPQPLQVPLMKWHGALAMLFLLILGALLPLHVVPGWKQARQRPSGGLLLALFAVLTASGWGLYYLGDDTWRRHSSQVHGILGLALPLFLAVHVYLGISRRSRGGRP
jgi:hypothetical protein